MKIKIGKRIKNTIIIDDEDYSKVIVLDLYYVKSGIVALINNRRVLLRNIIAGAKGGNTCKEFVVHANDDMLDFRKSNLPTMSRCETVANRDYRYAKTKFRGALNRGSFWSCDKVFKNIHYYKNCKTEKKALETYDAISDYVGAKGHRNFPDRKFTLTEDEIKSISRYEGKK